MVPSIWLMTCWNLNKYDGLPKSETEGWPRISLVGAGNLAWSLIPGLNAAGYAVEQLISRNPEQLARYGQRFEIRQLNSQLSELDVSCDVLVLCVPDQAIPALVNDLSEVGRPLPLVLHVSGTTSLEALAPLGDRIGVLYPLQTFTRDQQADFSRIPLMIEAASAATDELERLAQALSERVQWMNSADRLRLHLGAVMVCNFPNLLYRLAADVLGWTEPAQFQVYQPLIEELQAKVFRFGPQQTQTGPALRKDVSTLEKHLELLEKEPAVADLYKSLSRLIQPDLPPL